MKTVLAIDIGTTAVKTLLLTEDHRIAAEASESYDLICDHPGWAEEDAQLWWEKTAAAVKKLKTAAPEAFSAVEIIGVSGMVPAIVLLDGEGRVLRRSIQQNDARAVEQIARLKKEIPQEKLFARTGGYTNQQHILPRLLWVKENEPEVWSRVAHVLGSYDYINYRLTGSFSLERNWAVESGALDIREERWMTEMLENYGVDPDWLPPVTDCHTVTGRVTRSAAFFLEPSGSLEGVPVTGGSADHVASALASGVIRPGDLLVKFGGAGDILYCTEGIKTCEKLFYDVHDIPGFSLLNGCMAASGSLVKWYVNNVLYAATADGGKRSLQDLDRLAAEIPAGSGGLVVLPYFLGEKTPVFDPRARGVIFGLNLSHTYVHIYRAVLESVIYGFRHHMEVLEAEGMRAVRIFASDGGAKSSLWCRIAADILGVRVTAFPAHPGSSLGVGFAAGLAAGIYKSPEEVTAFLPDVKVYEPDPANRTVYDSCYRVYRSLYENTKEEMHLLGSL